MRIFVWALAVGVILGGLSRVYYAFVFLPRHHGAWGAAMRRIIDFDGWWSYVTSFPGLVLHVSMIAAWAIAVGAILLPYRAKSDR